MNRNTFLTVAVIAVALVALAIVTQRGDDSGSIAGASAGELLLPELASRFDDVARIEITGAGRERLVSLNRMDNSMDTGWTVAEQDGYPASAAAINGLLIALAEARIVEEKTSDPNFYSRLGVESVDTADATGVEVAVVAGVEPIRVVLGDAYGSGQRYARRADARQSVLIDRDPEIPTDEENLVVQA